MNVVTYANQGFAELPSEVRNHFDNDPVKFVDFLDEPGNESQLQEWGLLPLPHVEAAESPTAEGGGDPAAPPPEAAPPPIE